MRSLLVVALLGATAQATPQGLRDSVVAVGATKDPVIAERAARAYLHAHGIDGELVVVANRLDGSIRTVGFEQRADGRAVFGGRAGVTIQRDRVYAAIATVFPPDEAMRRRIFGRRVVGDELVTIGFTGELARERLERNASGTILFDVGVRRPMDQRHALPAPYLRMTVDTVVAISDAAGVFTWTGSSAGALVTRMLGTYAQIVSQGGNTATESFTIQLDEMLTWSHPTDEKLDAQLAAYIYVMEAKGKARLLDPDLAWLDQRIMVTVNEVGAACNASSNGDALHFNVSTTKCENTARLADIVHHEFGHSFHKQSIIAGAGAYDLELSEGVSDFFAANLAGESAIGRGIFRDEQPMRELNPPNHEHDLVLDQASDPHHTGLIIAGALWDLRVFGGQAVAEQVYLGIIRRAPSIDAAYLAAQIADDDDGDLSNGTPNGCAIGKAFALHGLAPDFATTTLATPILEGDQLRVPFTVPTNAACPPPTPVGATAGDAILDAQLAGTFVPPDGVSEYTVDVAMSDGRTVRFPDNLADPKYQIYRGAHEDIYCANMDTDPHWTSSSSEWEYGKPDAPSPDPIGAFTGDHAIGTVIHGTGRYKPGEIAKISTPAIEIPVGKYSAVHLQYRRWLSVEDSTYDKATIEANGHVVWTNGTDRLGTTDHVDREWRFHDLDVTQQIENGKLTIAWALAPDSSGQLGGWTLDDVCIVGFDPVGGEADVTIVDGGDDPGCCSTGGNPQGPVALSLLVIWRFRRRCKSR